MAAEQRKEGYYHARLKGHSKNTIAQYIQKDRWICIGRSEGFFDNDFDYISLTPIPEEMEVGWYMVRNTDDELEFMYFDGTHFNTAYHFQLLPNSEHIKHYEPV